MSSSTVGTCCVCRLWLVMNIEMCPPPPKEPKSPRPRERLENTTRELIPIQHTIPVNGSSSVDIRGRWNLDIIFIKTLIQQPRIQVVYYLEGWVAGKGGN